MIIPSNICMHIRQYVSQLDHNQRWNIYVKHLITVIEMWNCSSLIKWWHVASRFLVISWSHFKPLVIYYSRNIAQQNFIKTYYREFTFKTIVGFMSSRWHRYHFVQSEVTSNSGLVPVVIQLALIKLQYWIDKYVSCCLKKCQLRSQGPLQLVTSLLADTSASDLSFWKPAKHKVIYHGGTILYGQNHSNF